MPAKTIRFYCPDCQKSFSLLCETNYQGERLTPAITECPLCENVIRLRSREDD